MSDRIVVNIDKGIIVRHSTGIWYTNQAGGLACHHPEVEGYYVPVQSDWRNPKSFDEACESFHDAICWRSFGGFSRVNPETIALIDSWLDKLWVTVEYVRDVKFSVDTELISQLEEAWIPIVLEDGRRGILTYDNCD